MASTYSSLKIELIGTGDQAGTWGNTTNTNLGTAIEEAITGSANVTFANSNVALTLTDTNASQTARNLRLNLTGTISATRHLFLPAIEKQYIVDNGLTFPVTVANGSNSGATGSVITIPAGLSAIVFNDGVNINNPVSYTPLLGNVTINGGTANGLTLSNITYVNFTSNAAVLTNVSITSGNINSVSSNASTFSNVSIISGNINAVTSNASTFSNVTVRGGTSNGVTFTNATISSVTTPITVAQGGTGLNSGTSGGVLYYSAAGTLASSAALAASSIVLGGGAGAAPATTTTGTGVVTALGNAVNTTGGFTTINGTATLTNKRIDPRTSSTASTASLTPDISAFDQYNLTAQAATLAVNAPTGTPVDGNKLVFRILDNGVAQTINWNGTYTAIGVTLPTTTVASKMTYVGCIYNSTNTRWDVVAVVTQT